MPKIALHVDDCEEIGGLPDTCMVCGKPTEQYVRRNFLYIPSWTYVMLVFGVLPALIVQLIVRKRMLVHTPLCKDHGWHFTARAMVNTTFGILGILGLLACVPLFIAAYDTQFQGKVSPIILPIAWTVLGCSIVSLIIAFGYAATGIQLKKITDHRITFDRVHETFCEAYAREDAEREEEDRKRRQKRKQRRSRDDDRD